MKAGPSASWPDSGGGRAAAAIQRSNATTRCEAHPSSAPPFNHGCASQFASESAEAGTLPPAANRASSQLLACLPLVMLKMRAQLGWFGGCGIVHTRGSMAWHEAITAARARSSRLRMTAGLQAGGGRGRKLSMGSAGLQKRSPRATTESRCDLGFRTHIDVCAFRSEQQACSSSRRERRHTDTHSHPPNTMRKPIAS